MLSQAELYQAFDTPPDAIVSFLKWLNTRVSSSRDPQVADIGAGPGRLILPLAALGWAVTAYEPDADYFPALEATARNCSGVTAIQGGFGDISDVAAFDFACGINSSYAHLLTPSERVVALRRLARALRPQGLLILDLPNFPWILAHYQPPQPQDRTWGHKRICRRREHQIDHQRDTFTTIDRDEITDGCAKAASSKSHTYAIVNHDVHLSELEAAGFRHVQLFAGFEARETAAIPAARLLYVASRRAAA